MMVKFYNKGKEIFALKFVLLLQNKQLGYLTGMVQNTGKVYLSSHNH